MNDVRRLLVISMVSLAVSGGCATQWAERDEVMEIKLAGARTVEVESHNGDVVVQGGAAPEGQLVVKAKLRAGARSREEAQRALTAMELKSNVTGDVCEISYVWREPRQYGWQASVSYHVSSPAAINSHLKSHNGDVKVLGTQGLAQLETHNGDCRIEGIQGPCEVESHNGDVHISSLGGDFAVETFNGDIVASGLPQTVKIQSHNGDVQLHASGSGPLTGSLETFNGSITLTAVPSLAAQFVIETRNGRIQSDLPLQNSKMTKSSLTGVMGAPTGELRITTHNGDVVLK